MGLEAMGQKAYTGLTVNGRWTGEVHLLEDKLEDPLHLKKPRMIGVNYMGDLFHPNVTFEFLMKTFEAMYEADWHTYFVLTKRPERAYEFVRISELLPEKFQHVLIGTTVEDMECARKRVEAMTNIHEAGMRTWVSYEPALGQVFWEPWNFIEFMAAGGESGSKARMSHPDWFRSTRDWCGKHGIKYFFKQWGAWVPLDHLPWVTDSTTFTTCPLDFEGAWMCKVGKHLAGRVLDGRTWEEMPG